MVSLVLVLLLTLLNLSAFATVAQITSVAQEPGYENILFRNGYRGFCVDEGLDGAMVGDVFEMIPAYLRFFDLPVATPEQLRACEESITAKYL